MSKTTKIDFINAGQEFELPTFSFDTDVDTSIELMVIQSRVERQTAKDMDLDLKEIRSELRAIKDHQEISDDTRRYNLIVSARCNTELLWYFLKKLDPAVTLDQVKTLGSKRISELIIEIFKKGDDEDFQAATEKVAGSP